MHLVQTMAYVGAEPWHGLGNKLAPKQPLEVWARAAGMDCRVLIRTIRRRRRTGAPCLNPSSPRRTPSRPATGSGA